MILLKLVLEIFLIVAVFKIGFGLLDGLSYKAKNYKRNKDYYYKGYEDGFNYKGGNNKYAKKHSRNN